MPASVDLRHLSCCSTPLRVTIRREKTDIKFYRSKHRALIQDFFHYILTSENLVFWHAKAWISDCGWWEIDIHGSYSLVKIAFAPICPCKNNRRIWRHNASTSRSLNVIDQPWGRHNALVRETKNVRGDNCELIDQLFFLSCLKSLFAVTRALSYKSCSHRLTTLRDRWTFESDPKYTFLVSGCKYLYTVKFICN